MSSLHTVFMFATWMNWPFLLIAVKSRTNRVNIELGADDDAANQIIFVNIENCICTNWQICTRSNAAHLNIGSAQVYGFTAAAHHRRHRIRASSRRQEISFRRLTHWNWALRIRNEKAHAIKFPNYISSSLNCDYPKQSVK